jgi:hypothetical protein
MGTWAVGTRCLLLSARQLLSKVLGNRDPVVVRVQGDRADEPVEIDRGPAVDLTTPRVAWFDR